LPAAGPMPSTSGSSWVTSLRLPPVNVAASGSPLASTIRWCLEPVRPRSTGEGPVRAPLKSADVAGVHDGARPVQPADRVQAPQQLAVQPLPHAGGLPLAQPPPRGDARATDLGRNQPPRDPRAQTNTIAVNAARSATRGRPVR
jgi:hypothetical protein